VDELLHLRAQLHVQVVPAPHQRGIQLLVCSDRQVPVLVPRRSSWTHPHNRSARGLAGIIFTRDDRAGEGKLSSRLGLVTDAVEVEDGQDLYAYLVDHLSHGGRADYVIADEAQFLAPEQIDQLARVVDDLGLDVYAFGITTD